MDFAAMKVETLPGSSKGSVYAVVGEKKGFKLAIKPEVWVEMGMWVVGARVRIAYPEGVNGDEHAAVFPGFNLTYKQGDQGGYASGRIGVAVIKTPCSSYDAYCALTEDRYAGFLAEKIVESVDKAKGKEKMTKAQVRDWLNEMFLGHVSDVPPTRGKKELILHPH